MAVISASGLAVGCGGGSHEDAMAPAGGEVATAGPATTSPTLGVTPPSALVGRPPPPLDAAEVRRRAHDAMAAVTTWEQHLVTSRSETNGSVEQIDYVLRHELPDRHAIRVSSRLIEANGTATVLGDSETVRIGRRYWMSNEAGTGWSCTEDYAEDEVQPTSFVPDEGEVFLGLDDSAVGTWYRFARPTRVPGAATPTPWSVPSDTWVDAETFRVTRIDTLGCCTRGYDLETRRFGAFNSPRRIKAPAPCGTATPGPEAAQVYFGTPEE